MNQYEFSCKTATGKEYEIRYMNSTIIGNMSILYIEFINMTILDAVLVFSNVEETSEIYEYENGEITKTYKNFTKLIEAMALVDSKNVRIALTVPNET